MAALRAGRCDGPVSLPPDLRLRLATPADAEAGASLHGRCWAEGYPGLVPAAHLARVVAAHEARTEVWRGWASGVHPPLLAVRRPPAAPEQPVGFAGAGLCRDEDSPAPWELHALYVERGYWGTGVADALVREAVGDRACSLWVLRDNARARAFYARHGFAPDGAETYDASIECHEVRLVRPGRA